jgi:ribosomal protein S28E/S33
MEYEIIKTTDEDGNVVKAEVKMLEGKQKKISKKAEKDIN